MTGPQMEVLEKAFGRLERREAGLEECAVLLQHPSACMRSTAALLLSRMRRHAGVEELLERASAKSPDSVVRHFAASPGK